MLATISLRFYGCCFTTTNHQATRCPGDCSCGKVPRSSRSSQYVPGLKPHASHQRGLLEMVRELLGQPGFEVKIPWKLVLLGKSSAETMRLGFKRSRNPLQPENLPWKMILLSGRGAYFPMSLSNRAFWDQHDCLWTGWWSPPWYWWFVHPIRVLGCVLRCYWNDPICRTYSSSSLTTCDPWGCPLWQRSAGPLWYFIEIQALHSKESKICAEGKACGINVRKSMPLWNLLRAFVWKCGINHQILF